MTATEFLIINGGRLDPSWFAPLDLDTLLTAWLTKATGSDALVEAIVYARAYETLASNIMSGPATQRDRDESSSYTDAQFKYWARLAAYWRSKADALGGTSGPVLVAWEGDPLWRN